jgi:hypothetical protein
VFTFKLFSAEVRASFSVDEHTVQESDESVSVCFILTDVEAGFIQAPILISLTTESHSAQGVLYRSHTWLSSMYWILTSES